MKGNIIGISVKKKMNEYFVFIMFNQFLLALNIALLKYGKFQNFLIKRMIGLTKNRSEKQALFKVWCDYFFVSGLVTILLNLMLMGFLW